MCIQKDGYVQAQSRRDIPELALISSTYHNGKLILAASEMKDLIVPLNLKLDKDSQTKKTMIQSVFLS